MKAALWTQHAARSDKPCGSWRRPVSGLSPATGRPVNSSGSRSSWFRLLFPAAGESVTATPLKGVPRATQRTFHTVHLNRTPSAKWDSSNGSNTNKTYLKEASRSNTGSRPQEKYQIKEIRVKEIMVCFIMCSFYLFVYVVVLHMLSSGVGKVLTYQTFRIQM